MFIKNKYTNWYNKIIIKAQNDDRVKGKNIYYEKHHIIPKSIGGSNSKDNLVLLTAKEHYIVHLLLPKMCISGSRPYSLMSYAFNIMSRGHAKRYNSRLFETFRNNYYKNIPSRKMSEATKQKMSESSKGIRHSEESKRKMSEATKGILHPRFKGYYITPWGKFDSLDNAKQPKIGRMTVKRWCKNPNKVISNVSYSLSKYLQSLPENPVGKTFSDLGFGFSEEERKYILQ